MAPAADHLFGNAELIEQAAQHGFAGEHADRTGHGSAFGEDWMAGDADVVSAGRGNVTE